MADVDTTPVRVEVDEAEVVWRWRLEQARQLGLRPPDDEFFADSDGDLAVLRRMIRQGCDPKVAASILC